MLPKSLLNSDYLMYLYIRWVLILENISYNRYVFKNESAVHIITNLNLKLCNMQKIIKTTAT